MELATGSGLAAAGPTREQPAGGQPQQQGRGHQPEAGLEQGAGQIEPAQIQVHRAPEIQALARPRQGPQHREVPEKDLQQQRDIAENLDIGGRQAGDQPIARQPRHADYEAEQGRQRDAQGRYQQGIEQPDHKGAPVAGSLAVGHQALDNAEPGPVIEKAEAGGNPPALQVVQGIAEQVPAQGQHPAHQRQLQPQGADPGVVPPAGGWGTLAQDCQSKVEGAQTRVSYALDLPSPFAASSTAGPSRNSPQGARRDSRALDSRHRDVPSGEPGSGRGAQDIGSKGGLFFGYFLLAEQKKVTRPGCGHPV